MSKFYPGRVFFVGAVGAGREGSGNKVLCAGGEIWVVYSGVFFGVAMATHTTPDKTNRRFCVQAHLGNKMLAIKMVLD